MGYKYELYVAYRQQKTNLRSFSSRLTVSESEFSLFSSVSSPELMSLCTKESKNANMLEFSSVDSRSQSSPKSELAWIIQYKLFGPFNRRFDCSGPLSVRLT